MSKAPLLDIANADFVIAVWVHNVGADMRVKGKATGLDVALICKELIHDLRRRLTPGQISDDGALLLGKVANALDELTRTGEHFGVEVSARPHRDHA